MTSLMNATFRSSCRVWLITFSICSYIFIWSCSHTSTCNYPTNNSVRLLYVYLSIALEWSRVHCYCGHLLAYCTNPGWWRWWWWLWSSRWNECLAGETCPNASLFTTDPTWLGQVSKSGAAVGSRRLTAWGTTRLTSIHPYIHTYIYTCT
jgi:hypothetical protein